MIVGIYSPKNYSKNITVLYLKKQGSILYNNVKDYLSRLLSLLDFLEKWTRHMIIGRTLKKNLNSFFGTVSERCQSILSLSYSWLPQYLRARFLYVGGFPEDKEIDVSKLIELWIAEKFVRGRSNKRLEMVVEEYLQELIDRSLILNEIQRANRRMRTCKIHDLLRQLCLREAHTENVVHNRNVLVSSEAIDDQRRVIVSKHHESQVYPTRHSSGITSITRTFISMQYFGLNFPKGICSIVSQLKLLKVLDVLSVWYDFSCVIPELVHLRYVAARIMKALSLAKLRNLETIILAKVEVSELKHPLDIWTMTEIRHLDIESPLYISNPLVAKNNSIGEQPLFLNNLQTLILQFSPFVADIIRRTPNLKKLKIIDYWRSILDWLRVLDSLILLEELETLDLELANIDPITFPRDIFPSNLKKLRLAYTRIPWGAMNLLAYLPNLEVLNGTYAFAGTNWKLDKDVVFHKLNYLQIASDYLERWEIGSDNFPMLEQLLLYGMNKLEEIPGSIGDIMTLNLIQLEHCSSGAEISAKKIQEEQESLGNYELQVRINSNRNVSKAFLF